MEETSKPATKPDDITNGDRNVPHGESVTSSAGDDALSGNVQINSIDDSQPASVEKDSAEQIIPNTVDQNEIISKEGKSILSEEQTTVDSTGAVDENAIPPSLSENISGDVSIADSAKESSLDAHIAAARSMEVEEPTGNAVTVQDQKSSTGTGNEAAKEVENKSSELENMPQAVECGNEDLSVKHLEKDTSLAVPVASGSTMEVEEPTSKVSSFDTVLDSIASGETAIEEESKISQLSEKNSVCKTALAASAASDSSMEVEEPSENVSSTDVVQSPVTSTEFENEATKANSVDENLMPPPSVAPKAPLVSAISMEVKGNVASAITINDQIAEQQLLESEAVQKINSNSLSLLSQYSGSSDSESEDTDASKSKQRNPSSSSSDESEDEVKDPELSTMYRKCDDAILVSDAETMDTNAASSDDDDEEPQSQAPLRTKGEMLIDELPHIEELTITVPETECKAIGIVDSVVAQIVLVQSVPGVELLNLETVLFLDRGKRPLGKIFDVIGQVNCPIYCVLFNSNQEVVSRNITVGMQVYCAPRTEHTSFIILSELMRYKGSDASWMNDNEPPPHLVEYSDDEAEKTAKRNRKKKSNVNGEKCGETSSQHSQPDRQQQSHQHHQHRQQQFQYPYMPRPQFGRPPPNNRGNFYPQQQSGYSWHHNVNNPRYHHPPQYQQHQPQYQQRFQPQQQQYQPHQSQQYQHQPPQPQQPQQQQQFQQFPNTQPGVGYLPNPFAMFGQQPPPS